MNNVTMAQIPRLHFRNRRSLLRFAGSAIFMLLVSASGARAGVVEDAIVDLQHDWEVIRYQTPPNEREKRFEALAGRARKVSQANPDRAEPLVWEGIILSSWAREKGGLGALGLVKQAKSLYESAIAINGNVLDGSAYGSLGVLYYKVPGWPIGFGDKEKARTMLQKALMINPTGIDPNFFYGEFLAETRQPEQAITYLEKALQAPPRPGRQVADVGRQEEVRSLIEKIKSSRRAVQP